jgi:flagellar motor switch protein FliN
MTVTDLASDQLADTVVAAASAAAAAIPGGSGWQVEAVDAASPAPVPAGGNTVVVDLGASGRIVIIASGTLSRAVQVGPPPAEDVLEGLQAAFDAVVTTLTSATGTPLAPTAPAAGATAAAAAGPGEVAYGAKLLDGDQHAATLVVVLAATATAPAQAPVPAPAPSAITGHEFPDIDAHRSAPAAGGPLELLQEVEMGVTAELGRTRMLVREILDLSPGSVIELDRAAGAPVDVLVNGTLIARGEVVVIDEEFGIRVTEVIGYDDGTGRSRT